MKFNKFLPAAVGLFLLCSNVLAATPAHPQSLSGSLMQMLPMFVLLIAVFYFLLIRPQSKRSKEHRRLLSELSVGDEVVTNSGVVGKLVKQKDHFLVIESGGHALHFQKNAISSILPKGTIDSIE